MPAHQIGRIKVAIPNERLVEFADQRRHLGHLMDLQGGQFMDLFDLLMCQFPDREPRFVIPHEGQPETKCQDGNADEDWRHDVDWES